jgi:hypothetical protein
MNIIDSVYEVQSKFGYVSDTTDINLDNWVVMKERDGKYLGDCEDFALTVFWLMSGKNLIVFLWNLLVSGKYQLHGVCSAGSTQINHCIGSTDEFWFDNWTKEVFTKDKFFEKTKHVHMKRFGKFTIFSKLLLGVIFGKK